MRADGPVLLIVLDGFGEAPAAEDNAIWRAQPRFYLELREQGLLTTIHTSGRHVGLPDGQMGNSEVGHLTIGAGRTVYQEITRIDLAIESGEFARREPLREAIEHVRREGTRFHLMGLVSDGGVHASGRHVSEILRILGEEGLGPQTVLHAFLDGRDTPPKSARRFVADVERELAAIGGRIATVSGRYWAMDRDQRWDRIKRAWDAIVLGRGEREDSGVGAVERAYERGETDEFVLPSVIGEGSRVDDGDQMFFFNFRADRARQLSQAILFEGFDEFDREVWPEVRYLTMTRYRDDFPCPVMFEPVALDELWPELVSRAGMTQLRIAETEKYAHVTFFFGGGREQEYAGERRILVPSPRVATYDLQPEMAAPEVADRLIATLEKDGFDLGVLNFANGDMVGHTGKLEPAIRAVQTLDVCLAKIVPAILKRGGVVALTADHGNCEQMLDPETGGPHTAHTTNPVHFILVGEPVKSLHRLAEGGTLADIAPTLLPFLGLDQPKEMNGRNLAS